MARTASRDNVDRAEPGTPPAQRTLNDLASQILAANKRPRPASREDEGPDPYQAEQKRLRDMGAPVGYHGRQIANEPGYVPANRVGNYGGKTMFNLRGVVQVLEEETYDPTVAVVRLLKGEPDPDNPGKTRYLVEPEVRLRAAQELMKFVHPTRKAIEVNDVTPPRGEEIDRRMGELLGKYMALVGNGAMPGTLLEAAEDTIRELTGEEPFGEALPEEDDWRPEDMA